ncbi:hypothetical protein VP01_1373g2 [Puccinia sorghi]|uniref:Uncharacterized protein n=1 Tax=Puccinia sorghi TaxID=27349 RepID=A0A0L6VLS5_9BASI|nr:hypothetical protein VP01_1373g2 [Puccinia sorghi]
MLHFSLVILETFRTLIPPCLFKFSCLHIIIPLYFTSFYKSYWAGFLQRGTCQMHFWLLNDWRSPNSCWNMFDPNLRSNCNTFPINHEALSWCVFDLDQIEHLVAHSFINAEICIEMIWNYNSLNVFYNINTGIDEFRWRMTMTTFHRHSVERKNDSKGEYSSTTPMKNTLLLPPLTLDSPRKPTLLFFFYVVDLDSYKTPQKRGIWKMETLGPAANQGLPAYLSCWGGDIQLGQEIGYPNHKADYPAAQKKNHPTTQITGKLGCLVVPLMSLTRLFILHLQSNFYGSSVILTQTEITKSDRSNRLHNSLEPLNTLDSNLSNPLDQKSHTPFGYHQLMQAKLVDFLYLTHDLMAVYFSSFMVVLLYFYSSSDSGITFYTCLISLNIGVLQLHIPLYSCFPFQNSNPLSVHNPPSLGPVFNPWLKTCSHTLHLITYYSSLILINTQHS